ncbi:hypothetical protein STSP2_02574 [Anaerohalosphaera lusitana]|uniref:Uncharacterized protein n=1 Tax=Anaerohalosphaera lusitana TaxID=1936003 RepID=A0A1U9NNH7_9BACT|nr:hypothetical protein [Anaerohalosphaera lusitana]AQT69385.1 hypothetical protein STSP2_02574 [Anaerohalosphaera lusitana]
MAEASGKNNDHNGAAEEKARAYVETLSPEHKMLLVLKAQLYGGSWQPMLDDLNNRLEGKPYIFKLANRIKGDVERIEELMKFEKENDIDLSKFVKI